MATVPYLATLDGSTMLFKNEREFTRLCAANFLAAENVGIQTLAQITRKNGRAVIIRIDNTELSEQPVHWFREQADLYFGISNKKKGPKRKALVFLRNGIPVYFGNQLRFGEVCTYVAGMQHVESITYSAVERYCQALATNDDGSLKTTPLDGWDKQAYAATWKRLTHCDLSINALVPDLVDKIETEHFEAIDEEEEEATDEVDEEVIDESEQLAELVTEQLMAANANT